MKSSILPAGVAVLLSGGARDARFEGFRPGMDSNLMYSFHAYDIFSRAWARPSQESLQPFLELRDAHGAPLWLGEFGENDREWLQKVARLCEENGIGWALWAWKRVELDRDKPAIQTIDAPASWDRLADYLIGAPFKRAPSAEEAEQAMTEMLDAIATRRTREDAELVLALTGRDRRSVSRPGDID